ncbi:unnamed protein product, partial [Iphiclides podalirius]
MFTLFVLRLKFTITKIYLIQYATLAMNFLRNSLLLNKLPTDEDSQFENLLNDYENESNDIKSELIETEICINDDIKNSKNTEVFVKEELPSGNRAKKKTITNRLKKVSPPKQLLVKSIARINLSTSKKPQIFSCKLCKKIFSYPERYEAHKLEHEGKKVSIGCAACDKTFATWSGLRRHNESEHTRVSLDSLKCRSCGKTSKNRHTLRMHEKTHGQRSPCICDVCGRRFVSAAVLKAHLGTHEENRERRHECEQCGKKFYSKAVLLSHISKRHSGKKFICQICAFPFTEKSNLVRHVLLHEGKKTFKCDLCEKSYATSSSLVEHKRTHSGERPFACSYCPKSFSAKKRLDDHHRIHTGEKPHRCGVCGQGFTQRGTLKRHLKVHDKFPSALA